MSLHFVEHWLLQHPLFLRALSAGGYFECSLTCVYHIYAFRKFKGFVGGGAHLYSCECVYCGSVAGLHALDADLSTRHFYFYIVGGDVVGFGGDGLLEDGIEFGVFCGSGQEEYIVFGINALWWLVSAWWRRPS